MLSLNWVSSYIYVDVSVRRVNALKMDSATREFKLPPQCKRPLLFWDLYAAVAGNYRRYGIPKRR